MDNVQFSCKPSGEKAYFLSRGAAENQDEVLMFNVHFSEQREQSQACLGYAESRGNRSEAQCSIN